MSCWCCRSILVSNTRGGWFKPFYCNDKYFCHWIQWKHLGKTQVSETIFLCVQLVGLQMFVIEEHQTLYIAFHLFDYTLERMKKSWSWSHTRCIYASLLIVRWSHSCHSCFAFIFHSTYYTHIPCHRFVTYKYHGTCTWGSMHHIP